MRQRVCLALCAVAALGAPPSASGNSNGDGGRGVTSFGAVSLDPVAAAPFAAADLLGLAPVPGASAVTLTRAVDAASPRLRRAQISGEHFQTVRLAWSQTPRAVQSVCLGDVAVTSYAVHSPPGASPGIEHETLFFASAVRAPGPDACAALPPPRPVLVRLLTDRAGVLRARVDCLRSRCAGRLALLCPAEGCPAGGLSVGAFALGPGRERLIRVPLGHSVRGRHPAFTAVIRLAGRAAAIAYPVVVDRPPPPPLPILTAASPSPSTSLLPAATVGPPPTGAPPGGTAAPGGSPGGAPDQGPILGVPGGGGAGATGQVDTSLAVSCDGQAGSLRGVHGTLAPSLAGRPIEIDYVPADTAADTVTHNVTTGAGGRFSDVAGARFLTAVAFYPGDDTYVSSDAFCP